MKELDYSNCQISHNELDEIIATLKSSSYTTLNLENNAILDKGLEILGKYLENNSVISFLNLSKNEITPDGIYTFSDSLSKNSTLKGINLSGNTIYDKGVDLIKALSNKSMEYILLNSTLINKETIEALESSIKAGKFSQLNTIELMENGLGEEELEILKRIKKLLPSCSINLNYNNLSPSKEKELPSLLKTISGTPDNINLFYKKDPGSNNKEPKEDELNLGNVDTGDTFIQSSH